MMQPSSRTGMSREGVDRNCEGHPMRHAHGPLGLLVAALLMFAGAACGAAAQEPSRTLLYTLDPGETILNDDPLTLALNPTEVVLITTKGKGKQGPFFVLRDGARKGPFTSTTDAVAAAYPGGKIPEQRKRDCAAYSPGAPPAGSEPAVIQEKGGQTLRYKGATIGPHMMLLSHKVTPDGALAYAAAVDNDKAWFESSDGRKVSFGGTPVEFRFSPDGRNAAVRVDGRLSMKEMNDLSKLPPAAMAEAIKDLEKKYVYTIDGEMFGPFDSIDAMWFAKANNDLYFAAKGQLYQNGTAVPGVGSLNPCDFYPSSDGRSYAFVDYQYITFSDGKKYSSPLNVVAYEVKGKMTYTWIALEKARELVVYQRSM